MPDEVEVRLNDMAPAAVQDVRLRPYVQARQHDWVRMVVTIGLLAALGGPIIWSCRASVGSAASWAQTKEMLQMILPAITGLLGSVIGFYFGSASVASISKRAND